MILPVPKPFRTGLLAAAVSVLCIVSSQSKSTTSAYVRSYAKAEVECLNPNRTRVDEKIRELKGEHGLCSRLFPAKADCVDKLAFLYRCGSMKREEKAEKESEMFLLLLIGFFVFSYALF
jgi:hypothetical protein